MVFGKLFGGKGKEQGEVEISAALRDQILADERVRAEVQKAGEAALRDPAVQQAIFDVAREKGPQYAASAKAQVQAWAQDPDTQQRARNYAGVALAYAGNAVPGLINRLEQGPAGVRFLAFLGSCASIALAIFGVINAGELVTTPVHYLITFYQLAFALSTALFEADPEHIAKIDGLNTYQNMLIDKCAFMCTATGRGLFYIFQASLWLVFASLSNIFTLAVGLYLVFIGVLHLLMGVGIMPEHVVETIRKRRLSQGAMSSME